jgi:4-amino-4-deoxy-L-arabinose transferase-like glycosyltransferase
MEKPKAFPAMNQATRSPEDAPLQSKLWAARAFVGGVVAIVVALLGQQAIVRGSGATAGLWCYGVAFALALWSLLSAERRGPADEAKNEKAEDGSPGFKEPRHRLLLWIGIGLSIGLSVAAGGLVLRTPEQRWSALAWALGLLLLVVVARRWPAPYGRMALLPAWEEEILARGLPRPSPRYEALLVAAMLLTAAVLRTWQLDEHPGFFGDEAERGLEARAILEGLRPPLFASGGMGYSNLYSYAAAASLRVFGDGILGLRMLSVLSGIMAVVYVYRTGRLLWGPRAGLIAGSLLAVYPLHLQFSRFASESGPVGALWAAGFFHLFRILYSGRFLDGILSGLFFGLSLYFYASARLLLLLLPVLGVYILLRAPWLWVCKLFLPLAGVFLSFVLTCLPYGVASWKDGWAGFLSRYQETSIFSPQNRQQVFDQAGLVLDASGKEEEPFARNVRRHPLKWAKILFTQMRLSLEVFYKSRDGTGFYDIREHRGSMLSPLLAALTLLGLGYAAVRIADPRFGLLCLWLWGGLLGAALTTNTPSVQRLTGAVPALMLFPAALLDRVAAHSWPISIRLARRSLSLALLSILAFVSMQGIREYFFHYRSLDPWGDAMDLAKQARALGQDHRVYQLGVGTGRVGESGDVYFGYGPTRFIAKGVEGIDVTVLSNVLPITDNGKKGAAFFVYGWSAEYLPILRLFYPGGTEEIIRSSKSGPYLLVYRLSAAAMRTFQVLHARYTQPKGESIERKEPNLGTLRGPANEPWSPPKELRYPAVARWEGAFVVPAYGLSSFRLTGSGDSELRIDGSCVVREAAPGALSQPQRTEWVLSKGLHHVRLTGSLPTPSARIAVTSSFDRGPEHPVDSHFLFRGFFGGLSGEVWRGERTLTGRLPESPPAVRRIDPLFGFREARDDSSFRPGPFAARWRGRIKTECAGEYRFETGSNGSSRLTVEGQQLFANPGGLRTGEAIWLESGSHPLELEYEWESGRAWLELYWTPPLGHRELVPPDALLPETRCTPSEKGRSSEKPRP